MRAGPPGSEDRPGPGPRGCAGSGRSRSCAGEDLTMPRKEIGPRRGQPVVRGWDAVLG